MLYDKLILLDSTMTHENEDKEFPIDIKDITCGE